MVSGSPSYDYSIWGSLGLELAWAPGGGIVLGTDLNSQETINNSPTSAFAIIRLRANGTVDSQFGEDGHVIYPMSLGESRVHAAGTHALAVDGAGRILFVDRRSNVDQGHAGVWRLLSNGALDTSFGNGQGKAVLRTNVASGASVVTSLPGGKMLLAGFIKSQVDGVFDVALFRLNADGSPDQTFSGDGMVITGFGADEEALAMAVDPQGAKVTVAARSFNGSLLAGSPQENTLNRIPLARYFLTESIDVPPPPGGTPPPGGGVFPPGTAPGAPVPSPSPTPTPTPTPSPTPTPTPSPTPLPTPTPTPTPIVPPRDPPTSRPPGGVTPTPTPTPTLPPRPTPTPGELPGSGSPGDGDSGGPVSIVPRSATLAEGVTKLVTKAASRAGSRISAILNLVNRLAVPVAGVLKVRLFASADETLDGSDTEVMSLSKKLKLRQARAKLLRIKLPTDQSLANLHLFATVERPDGTVEIVMAPS